METNLLQKRVLPLATALLLPLLLPTANAMDSEFSLGLGVGVQPQYAGSNKSAVSAMPMIDYRLGDHFFASTLQGIGAELYYPVGDVHLYGRTMFNYDPGRKEKEEDVFGKGKKKIIKKLRGMGDIKGTLTEALEM
ncbi:MAG: MipA/OmpV family protein, partial [Enterobacteriaceae bacterium]